MEQPDFKHLRWMWLTLPLTVLDWWIAWGRIPERVPMKYGATGLPTSWAPRYAAMKLELGLLCGALLFSHVIGMLGIYQRPWSSAAVTVAVTCASGFVFFLVNWILWHYHVV